MRAAVDMRIGAHELRFEGDILFCAVYGVFTLADMQRFMSVSDAYAEEHGYGLVLADIDAATNLTAEARRYAADHNREVQQRDTRPRASALFGGSMLVRGVATLLTAGIRLVGGGGIHTRLAGSEAEARAFLAEQRQIFRAQLGKS